ncbi:MAG: hypothetical protein E6Q97_11395 [Desulfurellales bacterium]|nr:MAG: hypothetical protein E6Q97_11395 [Desulfurellales bacterium]
MSKLNVKQQLVETTLETDSSGVWLKITPSFKDLVVLQLGHYEPVTQCASAADLRELASIFVEAAELLEDGEKAQEKVAEPEEGGHEVHVKLSTRTEDSALHGIFSGLTDKQVKELQHAILVMDDALPYGMRLWAMD